MFSHERFNELLEDTVAKVVQLGDLKGGEYAGDVDRLANFRRNGERLSLPMEAIWAVYAGKHWDAIQQYCQDKITGRTRLRMEGIAGRLDDLILYCVLMKAIVEEDEQRRAIAFSGGDVPETAQPQNKEPSPGELLAGALGIVDAVVARPQRDF